jgi:hypothetical protein
MRVTRRSDGICQMLQQCSRCHRVDELCSKKAWKLSVCMETVLAGLYISVVGFREVEEVKIDVMNCSSFREEL